MCKLNVGVPFSGAVCQHHIIVEQDMCQNHLNLVGSEETTWTCVAAIAKGEVVGTNADKLLVGSRLLGPFLPKAVEAKAVKLHGVREEGRVGVDSNGRDLNCHTSGDVLAVGENDGTQDPALERG